MARVGLPGEQSTRVTTSRLCAGLLGAGVVLASLVGGAAPTAATIGGERLAATGTIVDAPGAAPLPTLKGDAWVLADLETGEVLAARNPHGLARPASTMKILTALALLPVLDPEAPYIATFDDANVDGSRVGVVPDATYTVHNLFEALFLVSGNDAASALAGAAGGMKATVARMNQTARDLGALDTTAVNPSGLDARGQLTSAYDLAVLTRAAMAREDFRAYAATVRSQFPGKMPRPGKVRKTFEIYTQDRLLLNYRGALGVKTGWTSKARGTFVGVASRGGRTLVATVLRTDYQAWRESAALLTWGFRNAGLAEPVGTLDTTPAPAAGQEPGVDAGAAGRGDNAGGAHAAGEGRTSELPAPDLPSLDLTGLDLTGLPWPLQVPLVLLAVVVLLRARVLLRRHLRRHRTGRARDPRDARRRVTRPANQAPTAAPTSTPRSRTPTDSPLPGAAPTGTGGGTVS